MRHLYTAFGLTFTSPFALPELQAVNLPATASAEVAADVIISFGRLGLPTPGRIRIATETEEYHFAEDIAAFLVRHGREIIIDPQPSATDAVLQQGLLGLTLTILLRQRGWLALHASAIRVGRAAVLFVGPKGAGKSTTAVAFAAAGHQILTDDIAALRRAEPGYELLPSFPRIRLHQEAATLLVQLGEGRRAPLDLSGKRNYALNGHFYAEPLPLQCIYLLADGAVPQIETPAPAAAVRELFHQAFQRYRKLLDQATRLRHFQLCLELSTHVPVRRLSRPREFAQLPALVRLVEADLAEQS